MLKESDLNHFTGTEHYYRHTLSGIKYTDGVQYVAREGKAYWLIDAIASYQYKYKNIPFQVWQLDVDTEKTNAILTMKEDSDKPNLVRQKIHYTDFPLSSIGFYLIDGVLLLKSEY